MTAVQDLQAVAGLTGLATGDQDEAEFFDRASTRLNYVWDFLDSYVRNPGLVGPAGDAAVAWAMSLRQSARDVSAMLATWRVAHQAARGAMSDAAAHLPEINAMLRAAADAVASDPRHENPQAANQAASLAAAAEALARQYLATMNAAVEAAIPAGGTSNNTDPSSGAGSGYVSSGSAWIGVPGGSGPAVPGFDAPDFGSLPGWTMPPQPADMPSAEFFAASGQGYSSGVSPFNVADWLAQHGFNTTTALAGAAVGLTGAAAVAAAMALGSGGVASLSGFRGLSGMAPAGGVVSPTQWGARTGGVSAAVSEAVAAGESGTGMGMVPPMGAAGGGQGNTKRRRGDYMAQHLENTDVTPPDPGWGAQAGTAASLPPAEATTDEEW